MGTALAGGRFDLVRVKELTELVGVLCAQRHALDHALYVALAELAESDHPQACGHRNAAHWLSLAGGMSLAEAHRYVRVGNSLDDLGELVNDAREGRIGVAALDQVAKVVTPANRRTLINMARTLSVAGLARALGLYRRYREVPESIVASVFHWSDSIDDAGNYRLRAHLRGATGELLRAAFASASSGASDVDDAVSHMATAALANIDSSGGSTHRVLIHAELADLAGVLGASHVELGSATYDRDGRRVERAELAQVIDDASVSLVVANKGKPLWLSNAVRSATAHQHKVLRVRSGGTCEVPLCGATRFLRAHHVEFHSLGGATDLDNLMLVCGFHHRQIHQHRWQVIPLGNQSFEVINADGVSLGTARAPNDLRHKPSLPLRLPEPAPHMDRRTPRAIAAGEPLTHYALDVYVAALLTAA